MKLIRIKNLVAKGAIEVLMSLFSQGEPWWVYLDYIARVLTKSGDGCVDIVAHMDPLGFEPPIVKMQFKRTTSQTSNQSLINFKGHWVLQNMGY